MYIATFMLSRTIAFDQTENVFAFVCMMTVLTGIMAPRLLLNIRREFYAYNDPELSLSKSGPHGLKTVSWQVAHRSENPQTQVRDFQLKNKEETNVAATGDELFTAKFRYSPRNWRTTE